MSDADKDYSFLDDLPFEDYREMIRDNIFKKSINRKFWNIARLPENLDDTKQALAEIHSQALNALKRKIDKGEPQLTILGYRLYIKEIENRITGTNKRFTMAANKIRRAEMSRLRTLLDEHDIPWRLTNPGDSDTVVG